MGAKLSERFVPTLAIPIATAFLLTGCAAPPDRCLLPAQREAVAAKLYFGAAIQGRPPLTDSEWARFIAEVVTPEFPDGFTTYRAEGQWRSAATGKIAREATHVVEIVASPAPGLAARLDSIAKAYQSRFRQELVGIVTAPVCAAL